ncbi:MAG: efflux RND transporter periplasmic adaptor subunit [Rhizobiaceae bacterium]
MDQWVDKTAMNEQPQAAQTPAIEQALGLDKRGRRKKGRRKWFLYGLVLALAVGAAYAYQSWSTQAAVTINYTSEAAAQKDMVIEVSASGNLQPLTEVDVSSEQSGVVREVLFKENDLVKKGEVLAVLDTTTLSAQVERAEASVTASKARIADAKTTLKELEQSYERAKSLKDRGTLSVQDLEAAVAKRDRAQSSVLSAEADLAVTEAELKVQQAGLAKSTIYAPIDGIILTRAVDPGQTVAASLSAPVLFVIAEDLGRMKLEAAIDEADIGMVAKGQKARFKVDAYSDKSFDATITQLAFASQTTDNVVSYEAELGVENADLLLRPGMTANVEVIVREANGVLAIPNAAFRYQPAVRDAARSFNLTSLFMPRFPRTPPKQAPKAAADGSRTVYVLEGSAPVATQIKTGATDGAFTEVLSGLKQGDRIILSESTAKTN